MKIEVQLRVKNETDNIYVETLSNCTDKSEAINEAKKRFISIEKNINAKMKDVVVVKSRILE